MSTALTSNPGSISAFYDVNDVLLQTLQQHQSRKLTNRSHLHQHQLPQQMDTRAPGTPITNNRNRAISPPTTSHMLPGKLSPNSANNMISFSEASLLGNIVREQAQNQINLNARRALERCISESSGDKNANRGSSVDRNPNINSSRYKTEMCRPFEENGHCKYGDKCQFAHGTTEQRSLSRHPKYKSELCRTFHTIGFCPYGPRCHFIHSEDEGRLNQINMLKHSSPLQQLAPLQQTARPIQRSSRAPALARSLSLPIAMHRRDQFGSVADSPPSSFSGSPTMSPTFLGESDFLNSSSGSSAFSPPPTAPAGLGMNAFTFPPNPQEQPPQYYRQQHFQPQGPLTAPLNIHTDTLAQLAANLQAVSLNNNNGPNPTEVLLRDLDLFNHQSHSYCPPSPPESMDSLSGHSSSSESTCGSPYDVSRNLRLPIFSQLSE